MSENGHFRLLIASMLIIYGALMYGPLLWITHGWLWGKDVCSETRSVKLGDPNLIAVHATYEHRYKCSSRGKK